MNTTIILSTFLVGVTPFTLTAINAGRFLAIDLRLRYQQVVTETRTKSVLVSLWMTSGLQSLAWIVDINAFILVSLFSGAVCLGLLLVVWIKIYQVVRHHQAQIQDQFAVQHFNMARFKKSA